MRFWRKDKENGFVLLPDEVCSEVEIKKEIQDTWSVVEPSERKCEWAKDAFLTKSPVYALDSDKLYCYLHEHPQYKNIEIPERVECWPRTFLGGSSLLNIMISPTLKYLGPVFYNCYQFENNAGGRIYYTGTEKEWEELVKSYPKRGFGGLDYTLYDSIVEFVDRQTFCLPEIDYQIITDDYDEFVREQIRYCTYSGEITIPVCYEDKEGKEHKITGVGMLSFAYNEGVEAVIIPPEIEIIGPEAFRGCRNLKEIIICEGAKDITIQPLAFYNCENLQKIHIGRIAHIDEWAFAKHTGPEIVVESVQDLNDTKYISQNAFSKA